MPFETLLTQDRIDAETAAGYWTGKIITDYLDAFKKPGNQQDDDAEALGDRHGRRRQQKKQKSDRDHHCSA